MHHRIVTSIVAATVCLSGCIGPEVDPPRTAPAKDPEAERRAKEADALVDQLKPENTDLASVAEKIAKTGDPAAIQRGSAALVALAERGWRMGFRTERENGAKPVLRGADGGPPAPENVEQLARVFAAMDALGGDPVVDFGLREASNDELPLERRVVALVLLEHHVDRSDGLRAARVASLVTELDHLASLEPRAVAPGDNAAEVLTALTPQFKECVTRTLAKVPNLDTKGVLTLEVAGDGTVAHSTAEDLQPAELAKCIEDVGKLARFDTKGVGGPFTLRIPFKFRPQQQQAQQQSQQQPPQKPQH